MTEGALPSAPVTLLGGDFLLIDLLPLANIFRLIWTHIPSSHMKDQVYSGHSQDTVATITHVDDESRCGNE